MESLTSDGPKKTIIIIGGSLCGLMHGILLKRHGHNIHILEQANSVRASHAAGITARDDVLEFMKTYDLTQEPWFIESPSTQFVKKDGKPWRTVGKMLCMTSWSVLCHRLRANFDGMESEYVKTVPEKGERDGEVVFEKGVRVVDFRDVGDGVEVDVVDVETGKERSLRADLVLGADGSNSFVRRKMLPGVKTEYSGYVAFRGCVPQEDVLPETLKFFIDKLTIFKGSNPKSYILLYNIPGDDKGTLESGKQLLNYVWYWNIPPSQLPNLMTDINGHIHRSILPIGLMRPEIWESQLQAARTLLPPPFIEVISATKKPFVALINEHLSPRASFFDGKLILVGDALSLFRPHVALSTNQSALHALTLEKVVQKVWSLKRWEGNAVRYAKATGLLSVVVGSFGQASIWRLLVSVVRYLMCIVGQKISSLWRWN